MRSNVAPCWWFSLIYLFSVEFVYSFTIRHLRRGTDISLVLLASTGPSVEWYEILKSHLRTVIHVTNSTSGELLLNVGDFFSKSATLGTSNQIQHQIGTESIDWTESDSNHPISHNGQCYGEVRVWGESNENDIQLECVQLITTTIAMTLDALTKSRRVAEVN